MIYRRLRRFTALQSRMNTGFLLCLDAVSRGPGDNMQISYRPHETALTFLQNAFETFPDPKLIAA